MSGFLSKLVNGTKQDWLDKAAHKKAADAERIPQAWRLPVTDYSDRKDVMAVPTTCGILTPQDLEITELDNVEELLKRLADGTWSAEAATLAYCKRASIAHQLTNCLSEFWFEDALARARELDVIRSQSGVVGPLHGLPVSLKDQFQVAGKECNMVWASWIGNISKENSCLVDSLVAAGAIVFARTNMAQGAWFPEGDNHVYGRVDNPYNRDRVPGGSSAGEGSLGALKGSAVGVGTDIGGSIRIPAAFCNLYSLRSTVRRFPYGRALNTLMGQENVASCLGPMCTNLQGCVAFTRGLLAVEPWKTDASVVPIPWRETDYKLESLGGKDAAKLVIGYYDFDGECHVHPPVKRAMRNMVEALKAAGHEVIPWDCSGYSEAADLVMKFFNADGGADLQDVVGSTGETIMPQVVVSSKSAISVFETYKLNREKNAIRNSMLERWQQTSKTSVSGRTVDALICPVSPYVAPLHRSSIYIKYTSVYNLLDWPVVTLPVTRVDTALDGQQEAYEPISEKDAEIRNMWDLATSEGMPVGLQLVGQPFGEESLLGVAEVVMKAYKSHCA